jgi:subtilisin-like proprotein convertase family protein
MDHTFIGDLTFKLTPPDGSPTVSFQARRGGTRENICLTNLNDEGGFPNISTLTSVTGSTESGNFTPETTGMLSLLDGENANGTWVLNVSDNAGIDTGSMRRFSLIFNSEGGCPSPSGTPVSTATSTATATATATSTPGGVASVQFSSATYTEDESQTAVITITRTGNTTGTTTVNFATSNGTATGGAACTSGVDYITVAQAVTFNAGETSKTVNVVICGDTLVESTQTVNLTLTGANLGSPSTAVLNINDTANLFRNAAAICTTLGSPASPYPSTISVTGGPVQIGALRVTLFDITHTMPDNMDFLLVSPTGRQMIIQADAGGLVDLVTPVTITFADNAGQVLPDSAPLTTGLFEPTSWQPGQPSFPAPAPPAPYNEPGSTVGGTPSLMSVFGLSNANGTWSLYMRDDANLSAPAAITGCVNGGWGIEFLTSTAAQASISGRVLTSEGQGIRNARIVITGNSLAGPIVATTGSFGYYTIEGLATGETYVVTVNSQRYTFSTPSNVISLVDNIADANFIADPQD